MPDGRIEMVIDGRAVAVPLPRGTGGKGTGITVAAALCNLGIWGMWRSVGGQARGPLCAMGVCHECRVTIDGQPHRRACLELCRPGMVIATGE
jgi:hypothetical protein